MMVGQNKRCDISKCEGESKPSPNRHLVALTREVDNGAIGVVDFSDGFWKEMQARPAWTLGFM